jgi:hypothetical protein
MRNLSFDNTSIHLTPDIFDFALSVFYLGPEAEVAANLEEYIDVVLVESLISWDTSDPSNPKYDLGLTNKEVVKCPAGRFGNNTEFTDKLGIVGNYYCAKDIDFDI